MLKGSSKKGLTYGTLGDMNTKVFVDEKLGLLEARFVSGGEVSGVYQSSSPQPGPRTHRPHSSSGSVSSGSQHTSRSASKRSSVASYRIDAKQGGYDLWNPRSRSRSWGSEGSGSSDEIYSRGSTSSSSTHCHDIITDQPEDRRTVVKLTVATVLSLIFMLLEYVGGYYSSSLAVLSNAGHLLSDFCGFLVSLVALCLVRRPPSVAMSFGYYRAEVLGSVFSVLVVWVVTGLLVAAAIQRVLYQPYTLDPNVMLIIAAVGFVVNIGLALLLHGCECRGPYHGCHGRSSPSSATTAGGGSPRKNMTMRTALIHVVGDTLQSLAVLVAAVVVKVWPMYKIADPILTFVFGFIVVVTTLPVLRELAHILMEGAPRNVDYLSLLTELEGLPGVRSVHNLHVWSLTLDKNALSVHLVIDQSFDQETVLDEAQRLIRRGYSVSNSTLQIERYAREMETCKKCQTPVSG